MKKPTDQDLSSLRIRVVEACANDLTFLSEIGPRVNRALHDAGIQWAADALESQGRELAQEPGQAEFAAAALMCAATLRRVASGG